MTEVEKIIQGFFEKIPQVLSVDLFGSYAENRTTSTSDIDIAILCDPAHLPLSFDLIAWREELSSLLKREVDLVCLNQASPILGMQVAMNGKNILMKNLRAYETYQIVLFVDYAELKELRAPMEKDILKRKLYDKP